MRGGGHIPKFYFFFFWGVGPQDSLLASPIILDLAILTELCQRITFCTEGDPEFQGFHSVLSIVAFLCKAPLVPEGTPVVNALFRQRSCIENILRYPHPRVPLSLGGGVPGSPHSLGQVPPGVAVQGARCPSRCPKAAGARPGHGSWCSVPGTGGSSVPKIWGAQNLGCSRFGVPKVWGAWYRWVPVPGAGPHVGGGGGGTGAWCPAPVGPSADGVAVLGVPNFGGSPCPGGVLHHRAPVPNPGGARCQLVPAPSPCWSQYQRVPVPDVDGTPTASPILWGAAGGARCHGVLVPKIWGPQP